MKLDDLTIGEVKERAKMFNSQSAPCNDSPWEIGACYMIRTVTMIDTGILVAVTSQELVLEEAAWIADTGRFAQAIEKAEFGEVEPFPEGKVIIGRGSIVDAVKIKVAPRSQK
ncbi:MAG: hypothetical protein ABSE05_16715 [Syntrophales bacterium]|jgi:hypothetical protein